MVDIEMIDVYVFLYFIYKFIYWVGYEDKSKYFFYILFSKQVYI